MQPFRSRITIRGLFLALGTIGLLVNVLFDLIAFSQNRISDDIGESVHQSMRALTSLERLDGYLNSRGPQDKVFVQQQLAKVLSFAKWFPDPEAIQKLPALIESSPQQATTTVNQISLQMSREVERNQEAERQQKLRANSRMLEALAVDAALIAVMLGLFLLNAQARRKTEEKLNLSLSNMRETLLSLEEEVLRRHRHTKTLVHDLKNPIGSIMGFAQLLHEDPSSQMTVMQFADRIQQISQRSLVLVESMLAAEDADEGTVEVDLIHSADLIVSQLEMQCRAKRQRLYYDAKVPSARMRGVPLKLEEMMSNLIGNAIKYSPVDSEIWVRLDVHADQIEFSVEDRGPGFSPQDKIHAFQYGKRLSAQPTNGESSTGIGLYIVKKIVDQHGGRIQILDAKNGKGTQVKVTFPVILKTNENSELNQSLT